MPTNCIIGLVIVILFYVLCVALVAVLAKGAQEGYEDERGFHIGARR